MDPMVSNDGDGNNVKTNIDNLDSLCDKLNMEPKTFMRKIGKTLGSQVNSDLSIQGCFDKYDIKYAMEKNNIY